MRIRNAPAQYPCAPIHDDAGRGKQDPGASGSGATGRRRGRRRHGVARLIRIRSTAVKDCMRASAWAGLGRIPGPRAIEEAQRANSSAVRCALQHFVNVLNFCAFSSLQRARDRPYIALQHGVPSRREAVLCILDVSSLNLGRARARPFFLGHRPSPAGQRPAPAPLPTSPMNGRASVAAPWKRPRQARPRRRRRPCRECPSPGPASLMATPRLSPYTAPQHHPEITGGGDGGGHGNRRVRTLGGRASKPFRGSIELGGQGWHTFRT